MPGEPPPPSTTRRVALVIAGARGVGAATALRFAREGLDVALTYHSSSAEAEGVAADVRSTGARCVAIPCDVRDDASARAAVAACVAQLGSVDVLVNCAGMTRLVPFADLDAVDDDLWSAVFATNTVGAFHVCRAASAAMRAAGRGGSIINVSSVAARLVQGSCLPYACSKAALDALTVGLARTLAPHGIRVNGVAPAFIAGRWLQDLLGDGYAAAKAAHEAASPLGRVCTAEDVAEVITSLALGAALVTGQTLPVDAGSCIAGFRTPPVAVVGKGAVTGGGESKQLN